jgi:tripartite-type tricarboxylate transporter receptor subunit TctC
LNIRLVWASASLQPHVDAGRARLVAVTNSQRAPALPAVPTVAEAGFPALTFDGLVGLFGPHDMAQAARDRIAADIRAELAGPAVAARLATSGAVVCPGNAAEFAASLAQQRATLAAAVKALGIRGIEAGRGSRVCGLCRRRQWRSLIS